jgi:hypothetical protein
MLKAEEHTMKNRSVSSRTFIGVKAIYNSGKLVYLDPEAAITDSPDKADLQMTSYESTAVRINNYDHARDYHGRS